MELNGTMNRDEIHAWLADLLHDMFEIGLERITLDARLFTELDLDSIDAVDLAAKLQELTGKRLAADVFKSVRTVGDVVNALSDLLGSDSHARQE